MQRRQQLTFIRHVYFPRVSALLSNQSAFAVYPIDRTAKGNLKQLFAQLPLFLLLPPPRDGKSLFQAETLGPQACSATSISPLHRALLSHQLTGAAELRGYFPNCPAFATVCPGPSLASLILTFMIPSCSIRKIEGSVRWQGLYKRCPSGQLRSREWTDGTAARGTSPATAVQALLCLPDYGWRS